MSNDHTTHEPGNRPANVRRPIEDGGVVGDPQGGRRVADSTAVGEPGGKRILVTGGAGFIGSHLATWLSSANDVVILDNFATGSSSHVPDDATVLEGSVTDGEAVTAAVDDCDIVVHMAAMMGVRRTLERPLGVLETNMEGTRTVLRAAAAADVDRVLFASTSEVYGDLIEPPYCEDDPLSPKTNYAVAKLADERYTRAFCEDAGIDHTVLRYFNVYGPRQESSEYGYVVARFVDRARNGGVLEVHGDGSQTRDFTFVDDAVDATVAALGPNGANETFNVGSGTETSVAELARVVVDRIGGGRIEHVEHPRPYRVRRRCSDVSRATSELGYRPRVGLERGIDRLSSPGMASD